MTFNKEMIEKYLFRFESDDFVEVDGKKVNICSAHAMFMVDSSSYTLSVESDWGRFGYRWGVSKDETFKELLIRIGNSTQYLLKKLSTQTEIDWKSTKKETLQSFFRHCNNMSKEERANFIKEVSNFNDYDNEGSIFYNRCYNMCPDMWEGITIVKEYPFSAKIMVEVLSKHLVQALKGEIEK